MKKQIGISTFEFQSLYGDLKAIEIAHEIGADAVDFNLNCYSCAQSDSIYSKSDEEIISYFSKIKEKADELGVYISQTHGRIRIYHGEPNQDKIDLMDARLDCLASKVLGAPYCVMHSIATSVTGPDADEDFMHKLCFDTFNTILGYAKEYNVKIAIETMGDSPVYKCCDYFGNLSEFKKSYEKIRSFSDNEEYIFCCIDTGHVNKAMRFNNNPTPAEFIRAMGKSIKCLHLNDNNTLTDQHKPPKTGVINWDDVLLALKEIEYDGIYNLELNLAHFGKGFEIETAKFSIKLLDFMLNGNCNE